MKKFASVVLIVISFFVLLPILVLPALALGLAVAGEWVFNLINT